MENKFKVGDTVSYNNGEYFIDRFNLLGTSCYIRVIERDWNKPNTNGWVAIKYIEEQNKTNKNMENKEFTIDDLKSGMIIETRSEEKYLVIKDCEFYGGDKGIAFVNATGFNKSNSYNKDLTCKKMKSYDIMKVYYDDCVNGGTYSMKNQPLIWQRKEKQQFTKAQIAEKLGLSIDEFEIK